MGGGSSQINYECDPFVANFIQENAYHLSELKSTIQDTADLDSISNTESSGIVIVTPKQSNSCEDEVRKKLEDFFEKYLSFEESFDPEKLPQNQQSSLSDCSNCTVTWKRNRVRISGKTADVKQLVTRIREAENLPPHDSPTSVASHNNNVPSQSNSSTSYCNLSTSPSNKVTPSQNNRPDKCPKVNISAKDSDIAEFIQRWPQYRLVLSSLVEDVAEVKIQFKQRNFQFCSKHEMEEDKVPHFKDQCKDVLEDFASQFSKWSITAPGPILQKAKRAQPGIFSQDENVCISICKDCLLVVGLTHDLEARKTELLKAIQTASKKILECSISAPDYHVACFLMNSNQTMLDFVKFCSKSPGVAKVQVIQRKKDTVEYQFSSLTEMLPEEIELFKNDCKMALDHFLTDFTSWEQSYPPEIIQLAMENGCVSFNNPTLSQKVLHDKIVLVGKTDVVNKNTGEICTVMEEYKNIYYKRYIYKFSFSVPPTDNYHALFINNSRKHSQRLQNYLSHIAEVHLLQNKVMLLQFTSVGPVFPDNVPQFENDCVTAVQTFFNQFSHWQSEQIPDEVMAAIGGNPILRTDEADVCVDVVDNVVIVSGLKKEVEVMLPKLQALLKTNGSSSHDHGIGTEENPTSSFFFCPARKYRKDIIQYIFSTPHHLNALKEQMGTDITMERHSNKKNPNSVKITTTGNEGKRFQKRLQSLLHQFFGKFQAVNQSFSSKEIEHARHVVSHLVKNFISLKLSVSWKGNSVFIVGLTSDVQKLTAAIEDAMANEKTVIVEENFEPTHLRYLTKCGVLDEIVLKYNGIVDVSRRNNTLKFSGDFYKIQKALKQLNDTSFVQKIPNIREDKIKLLVKALKGEFKEHDSINAGQIKDQFLKQDIIAFVELVNDEVFLLAPTEDMFLKASSFLGSLFVTCHFKLPENSDDFKLESICEVLSSFPQCYIFSFNVGLMELTTFDKELAAKVRDKVQGHLDGFAVDSYVLKCSEGDARFILNHWIKGGKVSPSIDGKLVKEGVECKGPSNELNPVVQQLKKRNLCRHKFVYSTPKLSTLLSEIKWKAFVTFLETNNRCTITADVDSTSIPQSSRFNNRDKALSQLRTKSEAEFGNIKVKVAIGDITADMSDAIINGATSNFNLSRGELSSAILKRAGSQMQRQCNTNPELVHPRINPYIKVTKGFNLLCECVVHMVTPSTPAELSCRLKTALEVADLMKVKSVAVPTLGAGGIGLETDVVAAAMFDAFHDFVKTKPFSIREIRVVVFKTTILEIFKKNITVAQGLMNYLESYSSVVSTLAPQVEDVSVFLVCDEPKCLHKVKTVISDEMEKIIITKTISDDVISQMTDHDRIGILDAASDCPVAVNFHQNSIVLCGLAENVNKVSDSVREMIFQLKDCLEKVKSVSWKWSFAGNKFQLLPARVSGELEAKMQDGAVHMVTVFGHSMKVQNEECELNGIKGRLKRVSVDKQENHGLPPQWKDMGGDRWKKVELPQHTVEFRNISKLFHKSKPIATIRKIERVQNPKLYKHYELNKSDVKEHMKSAEPVERELFHGTSQQDAKKICSDGFDRNFAGKNATFYGKGSYFAVNSSYSVNYARHSGSSTCCVFLANVITGDFCQGNKHMKAPGVKPGSNGRLYDSAVDSLKSPSIFVAFRDANVYPTYLITFT